MGLRCGFVSSGLGSARALAHGYSADGKVVGGRAAPAMTQGKGPCACSFFSGKPHCHLEGAARVLDLDGERRRSVWDYTVCEYSGTETAQVGKASPGGSRPRPAVWCRSFLGRCMPAMARRWRHQPQARPPSSGITGRRSGSSV
jgi:hypothetical protein